MGIIYVLQKDVPGLGRLTKVGMTMRSGEDRAAEYGGGGWHLVEELSVSVNEAHELQEIEGRIHDRLERFKCAPAVGFGLTEVFTCSANDALAAAQAEIGSKAEDADRVERLRQRTNRMVERKIMQSHAAAIARLHMDKYEKPKDRLQIMRQYGIRGTEKEIAEWLIHQKTLEALDKIGAAAPTFRAMLRGDLGAIRHRWDEAERARIREQDEKNAAAERARAAAARTKGAHPEKNPGWQVNSEERANLRAELAAHVAAVRNAQTRLTGYAWLTGACSAIALVALLVSANVEQAGVPAIVALVATVGAITAELRRRKNKAQLTEMRRNWDEAHSGP